MYLNEGEDARETERLVKAEGRDCLAIAGDVGDAGFCEKAVEQVIDRFGRLDVLVNNAAEQHPQKDVDKVTPEQIERTFRTNIFGYFFMTQAALPHLKKCAAIVNTTSVTAYRGSPELLDYSATKGAIVAFTRSLAKKLVDKGIRVVNVDKLTYAGNLDSLRKIAGSSNYRFVEADVCDGARMLELMRRPVVFDGRNIYSPEHMRALGFTYVSIGR